MKRTKIPGEWLQMLGTPKNNWANQRVGSSHMHPVKRSGMLTDLVMHSGSGCMSLSSSVTDYPFEYGKFWVSFCFYRLFESVAFANTFQGEGTIGTQKASTSCPMMRYIPRIYP